MKSTFIQNTFSFDRIFFQFSPMFLFSSIHFQCLYRPDAQSIYLDAQSIYLSAKKREKSLPSLAQPVCAHALLHCCCCYREGGTVAVAVAVAAVAAVAVTVAAAAVAVAGVAVAGCGCCGCCGCGCGCSCGSG